MGTRSKSLHAAFVPVACAVLGCMGPVCAEAAPPELDEFNVAWDRPGPDASASMPIGNGEVGANVWVEPNGDILLLVSRTDSWSEACRLFKVARLRISVQPSPFTTPASFSQTLLLRDGRIQIAGGAEGGRGTISIFVDADAPVVHVVGVTDKEVSVRVGVECWRTERRRLTGQELDSSWTMRGAPDSVEVWESADRSLKDPAVVGCLHQNEDSVVALTLKHQGLEAHASLVEDPIRGRISGVCIPKDRLDRIDSSTLATPSPTREFHVRAAVESAVNVDETAWMSVVREDLERSPATDLSRNRTADWWSGFWDRSWVVVGGQPEGGQDPADVGRAYQLQRWVQACGGRGNYPIKFNGSIFTVEPRFEGGPDFNPDWRRWGDGYWWQNTRLPYHSMPASGDLEMMLPLFAMYERCVPICEARAMGYYGARGVYFPETMTIFGTYSNGDYGWDRTGHTPGEVQCPWWQYAWNQGPELMALMLDYYDSTLDDAFLRDRLLPMSRAVLAYFESRFTHDGADRMVIDPAQALETHWHGVINDAPTVCGLHAVLGRLLALPSEIAPARDRELWAKMRSSLPAVPVAERDGVRVLSAAERFDPSRQNCESPELYGVFPFRLYGLGRPGLDVARAAFERRVDRFTNGWPQDGMDAALLGLVAQAKTDVLAKVRNSNPGLRFPVSWGPNFDWAPDQCHGSNLLTTVQLMLMQPVGDRLLLFPAWPREWDVSFRLHGPRGTVVEAELKEGIVRRLVITPAERAGNVVVLLPRADRPVR